MHRQWHKTPKGKRDVTLDGLSGGARPAFKPGAICGFYVFDWFLCRIVSGLTSTLPMIKERHAVVPLLDIFPVIAFAFIIVLLPLLNEGPPSS
jgi:hypothetical protein